MPFEANTGLGGVANYYGPRNTGGSVGVERSTNSINELSIEFTGDTVGQIGLLGPKFKMLAGAHITRVLLRVDQAFVITGTTPTVSFGSAGSVATNGVTLTQAELQAVGTKVPASTGNGTWSVTSATGLTADAVVAVALGGTAPVVTPGVGQATLVVEYVYKNRTVS